MPLVHVPPLFVTLITVHDTLPWQWRHGRCQVTPQPAFPGLDPSVALVNGVPADLENPLRVEILQVCVHCMIRPQGMS